ncbi:required for meiotic nuclear division protein 1 homolog isoform X2 [Mytilus galloprovincialis]|uniref:required for meiotic nuclear division protein 1 homolog isoform X2 n=1 Tax=Mytilus galloprovincialis TaxID=29158 RepID=UPI003F7CB406
MVCRNIFSSARIVAQSLNSYTNTKSRVLWKASQYKNMMSLKTSSHRHYTYSLHRSIMSTISKGDNSKVVCPCQCHRGMATKGKQSPKQVTALTVTRLKKKRVKEEKEKEGYMKVFAYPLTERVIDLENLKRIIGSQAVYKVTQVMDDMEDLLHLTSKYIIGEADRTKEVFIFREGSMVCWNVPELERRAILTFLHRHIDEPYSFDQIYEEEEWMEYSSSKNFSCLQGDVLFIQDLDHIDVTETINPHKYAFSNALAQTVKLAVWESALESLVDSIEPINRVLKLEKKVPCKRREILKMHGEIFELRFQMNLNSELLNTPDFYWEKHHALETLYKHLYNHLDIGRRTKVMNEKLNYCEQVIEVVDKQAADTRTERLERIIILLIMIEVMFELLYFYERKSLKKTDDSHIDGPTRQSDNSQIDGPS